MSVIQPQNAQMMIEKDSSAAKPFDPQFATFSKREREFMDIFVFNRMNARRSKEEERKACGRVSLFFPAMMSLKKSVRSSRSWLKRPSDKKLFFFLDDRNVK